MDLFLGNFASENRDGIPIRDLGEPGDVLRSQRSEGKGKGQDKGQGRHEGNAIHPGETSGGGPRWRLQRIPPCAYPAALWGYFLESVGSPSQ